MDPARRHARRCARRRANDSVSIMAADQMTMQAPERIDPAAQARIDANFAAFEHYLAKAEAHLARRELEAAAVFVAVATHRAVQNHSGLFWSPRAERVLNEIGKAIGDDGPALFERRPKITRILHVATQTEAIGGHSKMLRQWIETDNTRVHSLALTQHRDEVPKILADAVTANGGQVHRLNHKMGGQLDWARALRGIAREHDLVILHVHSEDVVPNIAFAEPERFPPILLLNHGDHIFWLGSSISHLVINLRDAASNLSAGRRGIAPERNDLLPTLVEPIVRQRSREEAKRELGIPQDTVVLASVARGPKYRTMNGVTFADLHVEALRQHPDARLLVVGPGPQDDWAPAIEATGGRIEGIKRTPNPHLYFEAADLYVDSYPFVSSTSLMEAAGFGLPMVTIFTAPDAARIYAINHVALVGTTITARSFADYSAILSRLIADPAERARLGREAQEAVARLHRPPGWLDLLNALYDRALALAPIDPSAMLAAAPPETAYAGEPDCRHEEIFGGDYPAIEVIKGYLGVLPFGQRIAFWMKLRREGAFTSLKQALPYLLPEWLKRVIKDRD
jgi:hypothetical protein